MFSILSIILGIMISLMLTINSRFALILGNFQSTLIIHIVGLGILIPILLFKGRRERQEKVPFYLLLAGVIGVLLILLNNICFNTIGASLTVSLVILGQSLAGQLIDIAGFLGLEKHPYNRKKSFGWLLIFAGAAVMTGGSTGQLLYILTALISGALVMFTSVLNAILARKIGLLRGTAINYTAGFLTSILILLLMGSTLSDFTILPTIHPLLIFGGGSLGVLIVSGLSTVIPRIPAVYSTILIFIGQTGAGLVLDYYLLDRFSWFQAAGALLIAMGLMAKIMVDLQSRKNQGSPA